MTSAVAPREADSGRGYTPNAAHGGYHHSPIPSYGSSEYPPPGMMSTYSSSPPDHNHMGMPYYPAQYIGYQGAPQAAPMPPHPQQHPYHPHPAAGPPMYYGSWPGSAPGPAPPPMGQQVHYGSYPILPPDARDHRHGHPGRGKPDEYGTLELNAFDVSDEMASAMHYVRMNPKATLFDVDGLIPDLAMCNEGSSRFVQRRVKLGSAEERRLGLKAALSSLGELCLNEFGNFMLQGLFEFGSADVKRELMDAIYDEQEVVSLCMHAHGCRVIQKAIRSLDQEDVCKLIAEFHDQVVTFIHDPNGNHVIQRSIQVISTFAKVLAKGGAMDKASALSDKMQFIVDDICADIQSLSSHRYGCRVVQRAIEHCVEAQKALVLDKIVACHEKLISDQYGNYVIQQVMACGSEVHKTAIVDTLTREKSLLRYSKHKYASNVVEAVLIHGKTQHKEQMMEGMMKDTRGDDGGYCCAIEMAKDPIANYVVNKAIEVSEGEYKERFVELISASRPELAKSIYAKYVLQRIDKRDK